MRETVDLCSGFFSSPRPVDATVDLVGLAEKRDACVGTLSGGQRRRVDVAVGIIGDPDLIFLDEPTTGFDPAARPRGHRPHHPSPAPPTPPARSRLSV